MTTEPTYTIADLARLTGVNVRTIRYYLAQGLLPASGESGPGAHYGEGHLNRLRLTRRLQEQHLPLAEIRRRLAELTDAQAAELLAESVVEQREARQTSALEYVRSLLGQGPAGAPALGEGRVAFALPASSAPPPAAALPASAAPESAPAESAPAEPAPPASMSRRAKSMPIAAYLRPRMPRMRDEPAPPLGHEPAVSPSGERLIEPQSHERSQWERLSLGPNVEIHIRRPLSRLEQRRVERLITIARQVLKEDKP